MYYHACLPACTADSDPLQVYTTDMNFGKLMVAIDYMGNGQRKFNGGRYIVIALQNQPGLPDFSYEHWKNMGRSGYDKPQCVIETIVRPGKLHS